MTRTRPRRTTRRQPAPPTMVIRTIEGTPSNYRWGLSPERYEEQAAKVRKSRVHDIAADMPWYTNVDPWDGA